jgi:hypothetical protein
VKNVIQYCVVCHKMKKKVGKQMMGSLPISPVSIPIRAFAKCGIDFAGPYMVKITRFTCAKGYLCLLTCLSSS